MIRNTASTALQVNPVAISKTAGITNPIGNIETTCHQRTELSSWVGSMDIDAHSMQIKSK